jgi:hypothetical protein
LKILKEYKTRLGDNMELYIQKNKGIWTTRRNLLLNNKECDYLVFLDGDDTWRKNFLKHCSEYFSSNPDVIYINKIHWQKKFGRWIIINDKVEPNLNDYKHKGRTVLWNKMWNANFLKKYATLIPKCDAKKVRCEDSIINLILNSFVKTVKVNKHMDYNYFYRNASLTHNKNRKFNYFSIEACKVAIDLLNKTRIICGSNFDIYIFEQWLNVFEYINDSIKENIKNL